MLEIAGLAGVVLGVLGLAGVLPAWLDGLALIVLGGGLVVGSGLFRTPPRPLPGAPLSGRRVAMGSFTTEVVFGVIASLFGILALTRMSAINLSALGVISLGIALWAGSLAEAQLALALSGATAGDRKTTSWIIGLSAAIALGSIILGVVALFGVSPRALTLICAIAVGTAVLLTGTVVARGMTRSPA